MDITDLPTWFLDVQRAKQDMVYGRIPLEIVIANNQIAKVIGTRSKQVKFRNNEEARIFILNEINAGEDGTSTFSVIRKNGKITQVNVFDQIEHHYDI